MRVEANVSLRPRGTEPFGTRVEVKNMNSFRSVERAIAFEIERQAAAIDAGETLTQDTRGWDENRGDDVRDAVQGGLARLPLLPGARPAAAPRRRGLARRDPGRRCRSCRRRAGRATRREFGLSAYDAAVLVAEPRATELFEGARAAGESLDPKTIANWVTGAFLGLLQDRSRGRRAASTRPSSRTSSGGSSRASCRGPTPRRSSPPTPRAASRSARSSRPAGSARSRTPAPSPRSSTR